MNLLPEQIYVYVGQIVIIALLIYAKSIITFFAKSVFNRKSADNNPNLKTIDERLKNIEDKLEEINRCLAIIKDRLERH